MYYRYYGLNSLGLNYWWGIFCWYIYCYISLYYIYKFLFDIFYVRYIRFYKSYLGDKYRIDIDLLYIDFDLSIFLNNYFYGNRDYKYSFYREYRSYG